MSWLLHAGLSNAAVAAVLAAGVFALSRLVRNRALIHGMWIVVLVKLVTPPLFDLPLPIEPPTRSPVATERVAAEPRERIAANSAPIEQPDAQSELVADDGPKEPLVGAPLSDAHQFDNDIIVFAPAAGVAFHNVSAQGEDHAEFTSADEPPVETSVRQRGAVPAGVLSGIGNWQIWLVSAVTLWLVGAVVMLMITLVRANRFHWLLKRSIRDSRELGREVSRLAKAAGIRNPPRVYLVSGVVSPMLWPLGMRPAILFPAGLAATLDRQARETLLLHELAHFYRGDHWVRLLEVVAVCLHWWNPLVWWIRCEVHHVEEDCCDAWVVAQRPDIRSVYARALVETIDFLSEGTPALPPMASGIGYLDSVKRRLQLIMQGAPSRGLSRAGRFTVAAFALALAPLLPTLTTAPAEEAPATASPNSDDESAAADASSSRGSGAAPGGALTVGEPDEFENQAIVLLNEPAQIRGVAFSPDGRFAASGGGDARTPGELVVWDLKTGQEVFTLRYQRGVRSVAFSPDGKLLAAGTFNKTLELIEPTTGETLASLTDFDGAVNSVAFSPDGSTIAGGSLDKTVKLFNTSTHELVKTLSGHSNWVFFVSFSPDGKSLASCGRDKTLRIWNLETGELRRSIDTGSEGECVVFSPDGKMVAVSLWDGNVKLYDANGDALATLNSADRPESGLAATLAFSPDSKTLLAAGASQTVKSWNAATFELIEAFKAHDQMIWSIALSADGSKLLTGGDDRVVKLWDAAEHKESTTLVRSQDAEDRPEPILAVAWSPDGSTIATSHEDFTIRLRNAESGDLIRVLRGHEDVASSIAFSPDGMTLASGAADNTVRLWSVATGEILRVLEGHTSWVFAVAFSHDGKRLATGGYDKTIRLWDVASGEQLAALTGHEATVRSLSFSPDDKQLASGGSDRSVRLWNLQTKQQIAKLDGHEAAVRSVAFSPDGGLIASGSEDKTIKLWDPATHVEVRTLSGHNDMVWCLAFSPGGATLASGGFDNEIKLWNPASGAMRQTLRGHTEVVASLAFAPDTSALASAGYDRTLRIWKAKGPPLPVATALAMIRGGEDNLLAIAMSPDGSLLAAAGKDKTVTLRDLRTGRIVKTIEGLNAAVSDLAFSPDGSLLAVSTYGPRRNLSVWKIETREMLCELLGHTAAVWRIAFSPDGKRLASASWDKTARVWDVGAQKLLHTTPEQSLPVSGVAFSPDGRTFATSTGDWQQWQQAGEVKLWETKSGRELQKVGDHALEVKGVCFPGGSDRLISFGSGMTRQWNLASEEAATTLVQGRTITALSPLPDGRRVACGDTTGAITLFDLETQQPILRYAGHKDTVSALDCSADGSLLVSLSHDGSIRFWPTSPSRSLLEFKAGDYLVDAAVSPDGKAAICMGLGYMKLFDLENGNLIRDIEAPERKNRAVVFTPDGRRAVSCAGDHLVHVWDVETGKELLQLKGHQDEVRCVAISPDGARAATGGLDKTVIIWDLKSGRPLHRLEGHPRGIWSIAWSADGRTIASGGQLDARLWNAETGASLRSITVGSQMSAIAFAADDKSLFTGQNDASVCRWDVETGNLLWRKTAHTGRVTGVCPTRDGEHLLTSGLDGSIYHWDLERDAPPLCIGTHSSTSPEKNRVTSLALSPDEAQVVSAGADGMVRVWNRAQPTSDSSSADLVRRWRPAGFAPTAKLALRSTLSPSLDQAWFANYSPDGKWLAVGGRGAGRQVVLYNAATLEEANRIDVDSGLVMSSEFSPDGRQLAIGAGSTLRIWNTQRREFDKVLRGHSEVIRMISYSPDGRRIATVGEDGIGNVWDLASGKKLFTIEAEDDLSFYCVAYSPDGRLLATGGGDWRARKTMEVKLWDAETGELQTSLPDSNEVCSDLAFSPDGRFLVARASDAAVAVWNVATGKQVTKFSRLRGTRALTFSRDGRRLAASASTQSGIVSIIDPATGQLIVQVKAHDNIVSDVGFSPDGATFATASLDGTVKLWNVEEGSEVQEADGR